MGQDGLIDAAKSNFDKSRNPGIVTEPDEIAIAALYKTSKGRQRCGLSFQYLISGHGNISFLS